MVLGGKKLRAIDVYSGVGGWSLGLAMAGIDVVESYEISNAANRTNHLNNGHATNTVDLRGLKLESLPSDIDIVVGSPPCTEFSYSNRGGGGDIKDGLRDIATFLTIVDYLKPRWWVMENVPRVAVIIEKELGHRGRLARFRHLTMKSVVLNMEDFGLPQRRRRCLVGNLDFDLLRTYADGLKAKTLGDIVSALDCDVVVDPLFGIQIPRADLREHDPELYLDPEERRINEASKTAHPVYNAMTFPDPQVRSVRTITATCTRVSRESVIIEQPGQPGCYRRLTIRERACLQGFPITYQFFGTSYSQKVRMVGNAIPPAFSFYVGHAICKTPRRKLPSLQEQAVSLTAPSVPPPVTKPDRNGRVFPAKRTFRFAIPELRLKSGVRFEMANLSKCDRTEWEVRFIFGTSKDICDIALDEPLNDRLRAALPVGRLSAIEAELSGLSTFLAKSDVRRMQAVWSHRGPGGTRPFAVIDRLGATGRSVISLLRNGDHFAAEEAIREALAAQYGREVATLPGVPKLIRNAPLIYAGLLVGTTANIEFARHFVRDVPTPRRQADRRIAPC